MKNKAAISIGVIVLIIGIISIWAYNQYKKALKYCWKINIPNTRIEKIGIKQVKMNLALDFKNTADIDLNVYGYSFDVLLNGVKVGGVVNESEQKIKSNGFSIFNLGIDFSPEQAFKDNKSKALNLAKDFLTNKENIILTVKGTVSAGALGIKMEKVPLAIDFSLAWLLKPSTEPEQKCN